eukprot:COSAG05_NODE_2293_length_3266_cov_456.310073_1_plen_92_part_00
MSSQKLVVTCIMHDRTTTSPGYLTEFSTTSKCVSEPGGMHVHRSSTQRAEGEEPSEEEAEAEEDDDNDDGEAEDEGGGAEQEGGAEPAAEP